MSALIASIALVSVFCALTMSPQRWLLATRRYPVLTDGEPLDVLWAPIARMFPVGELAQRLEVLSLLLIVATAAATTWAGYRLFRGKGRWLASVSAGPVTALSLVDWLHQVGPARAIQTLPVTAVAIVAALLALQPLTATGHIGARARTQSLAGAGVAALLSPRVGIPLLVILLIAAWIHEPPAQGRTFRRRLAGWLPTGAIAGAPVAVAATAAAVAGARWSPISWLTLTLRWPDARALGAHLPPTAFYCGLALIGLTAVLLRRRGGPLVLVLTLAGLTLHDAAGPLAPTTVPVVLLSTAAAAWIWLLGAQLKFSRVWSGVATAGVAAIVIAPMVLELRPRGSVASQRPVRNVMRGLERGLVAPGDGVFVFGPWADDLVQMQYAEGLRPDVEFVTAKAASGREQLQQMMQWDANGRRILSDRFDGGGGWTSSLVVDSGPLFWLAGHGADEDREFTDLTRFEPDWSGVDDEERRRWGLIVLERVRFRRALAEPEAALEALPLSPNRKQGLITRLQLSRRASPDRGRRSEVAPLRPDAPWNARARFIAEAADVMYEHGEHARAAQLFAEANELDPNVGALGALARWQLRAGESSAAAETLGYLASEPDQHREALHLMGWALHRERWTDAEVALDHFETTSDHVALEVAARIGLLAGQSTSPQPPMPAPPSPTVSRRDD